MNGRQVFNSLVRGRAWRLWLVFAGLAAAAIAGWLWRRPAAPVNILFVTLDTTRADRIGCYGHDAANTPTLDALAARGVLFERAYAPAPMTAPSHVSMFTGLFPPEHGVWTNGGAGLAPDVPVLAELLKRHGYAAAAFISSMVLEPKCGLSRGFDHYDSNLPTASGPDHDHGRSRDGKLTVDAARNWLTGRPARNIPFFCWVHLFDPHDPYLPHRDEFGDEFADRPYDAEIAYVDRQLERLFAALKENGCQDRTVIVVIGDHGEGLGDHGELQHGYMLHGSTLRVPFIVADPRDRKPGRRIATPVSLVDVFPTLMTLAGLKPPEACADRDLQAALQGNPLSPRHCYAQTLEAYQEARWSPLQSLTTDRWHYVRTSKPELYDLLSDQGELRNLAGESPDQISELDGELAQFLQRLRPRLASQSRMSDQERRALESLGYVGATAIDPNQIEIDDKRPDIKDMIVHLNTMMAARKLIEQEQYPEAVEVLRPLAETVPNFLRAQFGLAISLFRQRRLDEAAKWFESVVELDPHYEPALEALGFIYIKLRKLELAEAHLTHLAESNPQSETAHLLLGEVAQRNEQFQLAMKYYTKVLELNPRNRQARDALEMLYEAGIRP